MSDIRRFQREEAIASQRQHERAVSAGKKKYNLHKNNSVARFGYLEKKLDAIYITIQQSKGRVGPADPVEYPMGSFLDEMIRQSN